MIGAEYPLPSKTGTGDEIPEPLVFYNLDSITLGFSSSKEMKCGRGYTFPVLPFRFRPSYKKPGISVCEGMAGYHEGVYGS